MIMKSNNFVETSENFEEKTFGIREEDLGIILEILRGKLYSNPIGSICREIACNARDANREVGKATLPIEIKIEDSPWLGGDLAISFKDSGPGISPDRIATIFINYGASTKRASNEFTGGFGIGCKSPFSYTDSFVIVTIVDGIEYVYAAAIEEGRRGKLFMLNKQETTEANGTSVIVPIKSDHDRGVFEEEVYNATIQWDVVPKYVGFNYEAPKVETIYVEERFRLLKGTGKESIALLIDGIYYPLDMDQIDRKRFCNNRETFSLLLEFKTGDLTVSANRENVQYDKQTIAKIKERLEYFIASAKDELNTHLRSSKNIVEAAIRLAACKRPNNRWTKQTTMYYLLEKLDKQPSITFPSLTGEVLIQTELSKVFPGLYFQVVRKDSDYYQKKRSDKGSLDGDFIELPLYWFDMTGLSGPRNRTIFSKHEEFLLVQFYGDLAEWKTLSFRRKKRVAVEMREALRSANLLRETLDPPMYSSVEGTSIERVKSCLPTVKETLTVYGRIKDRCEEAKVELQVKNGEIISFSGEGASFLRESKGKIFYVVTDSLRPSEATNLHDAYNIVQQVQNVSNWKGLIINERGEKLLRNSLTHYKVVIDSLYESLCKSIDLYIEMDLKRGSLQSWVDYNRSFLIRFKFKDVERDELLQTILKTVEEEKKNINPSFLLGLIGMKYNSDTKEIYNSDTKEIVDYKFSERAKEWKDFLLGLANKYPLAFINGYYNEVRDADINTYIQAMDVYETVQTK